ncbi:MAG: YegS/Rv2252/BmrU family lipid kinase [Erysipelotrichia bacterium]|nr:YegS/Rv2252/BmrU family lipid kinase [Erysipelotrichia bacterium]
MHFVFIINPAAGKENSEKELLNQLKEKEELDYSLYYTKSAKDATNYVRNLLQNNSDKYYCFVACGGDGTINEVVNGMIGFDNCCFTVYPCGSGNDYVKYFGGSKNFLCLDELVNGREVKVDVMQIGDKYSVNVVNFGFDCVVLKTMEKVKRKFLIGGKNAYTTGIIGAIFTGRKNYCKIYADGKLLNPSGEYMLCTIANGSHVGGSFNCAPRSLIDDGYMEVCLADYMSIVKFASLAGIYQKGLHLDNEKFKDVITYVRAKKVELVAPQNMDLSIDGEIAVDKHFVIENHQKMLSFLAPVSFEDKM